MITSLTGTSGTTFGGSTSVDTVKNDETTSGELFVSEETLQMGMSISSINAQISQLQSQITSLTEQRAALQENLERYNRYKSDLTANKAKIEQQIAAYEQQISDYEKDLEAYKKSLEKEQKALDTLRAEFKQKTDKAEQLDKQLQEKISEVLSKSKKNVENQKEKVEAARKEAQEKVDSGEITQEDVGQYIIDKVGGLDVETSYADLEIINSLCAQIKNNIAESQNLISQIGDHETKANEYQAKITNGTKDINILKAEYSSKKNELKEVNSTLDVVNAEIRETSNSINSIDSSIAKINDQIAQLEASKNQPEAAAVNPLNVKTNYNTNFVNVVVGTVSDSIIVNPFEGVQFETVTYKEIVDAFDVKAKNTDLLLETVRSSIQSDIEETRNIFLSVTQR